MTQQLTPDQLNTLLTDLAPGSTIELTKLPSGEIAVSHNPTKQQLLKEKYSHLQGRGISISDAAKKYKVPRKSIENWVYISNYVQFVDEASYPKLVNEAEVALCAQIYQKRQKTGLTGTPYFDEQGQVVTEHKHPDLAEYRRKQRGK